MENICEEEIPLFTEKDKKYNELTCEAIIKIGKKLENIDERVKDIKIHMNVADFIKSVAYIIIFVALFCMSIPIYSERKSK